MIPGGIYIHVPFCRSRCDYCAFYAAGLRLADWNRFTSAVEEELKSRAAEITFNPKTLYIGGGTPSLIPPEHFRKLSESISSIIGEFNNLTEFTVEANPDDISEQLADQWRECGVNRVSLGIQSFDRDELLRLGRRHNPDQVFRALEILKSRFDNISIDLIYGVPGQYIDDWCRNLSTAVEVSPDHISLYSLTFEERTSLALKLGRGDFEETDEDIYRQMYLANLKILGQAGFHQYETSNFAIPGKESIHNSSYWEGTPYLGLGPAAASYDGNRKRTTNRQDLFRYLSLPADDPSLREVEILSDEDLITEFLMTRLRRAKGFQTEDFINRFGEREFLKLLKKASPFLDSGDLILNGTTLRASAEGLFILDLILPDII